MALKNDGRHIVSQLKSQRIKIGLWEWTDILIIFFAGGGIWLFVTEVFNQDKLTIAIYILLLSGFLFYELPDYGLKPISILTKKFLYLIRPKRFMHKDKTL